MLVGPLSVVGTRVTSLVSDAGPIWRWVGAKIKSYEKSEPVPIRAPDRRVSRNGATEPTDVRFWSRIRRVLPDLTLLDDAKLMTPNELPRPPLHPRDPTMNPGAAKPPPPWASPPLLLALPPSDA